MKPKVFYNDACLVCKIEINHYKKKCQSIEWSGLFAIKNLSEEINKTPKQLVRKLHIKLEDKIIIGVDAFIFIWSQIPKYKYLSRIIKLPIIYHIALILYEIIALLLYFKNYKHVKRLTK